MKKRRQKSHARKRFKERLGVDLTNCLEKSLINKIRTGKAQFLSSRNSHSSIWNISFSNSFIKVVYDNRRGVIVTVLS